MTLRAGTVHGTFCRRVRTLKSSCYIYHSSGGVFHNRRVRIHPFQAISWSIKTLRTDALRSPPRQLTHRYLYCVDIYKATMFCGFGLITYTPPVRDFASKVRHNQSTMKLAVTLLTIASLATTISSQALFPANEDETHLCEAGVSTSGNSRLQVKCSSLSNNGFRPTAEIWSVPANHVNWS